MKWKSINEVCRPRQWKTIAMKNLKEDGYPVYGANGIIGYYDEYTHEEDTIMITCRGATCGTINLSKGKSYINGNAMALDSLKEEIVNRNYLYYYLRDYDFTDIISGSAQPQITGTNLSRLKIPVPPIEIQKQIVEVLDEAQKLIDNRKEQIELLDDLIESIFYDMFGDPVINDKAWEVENLGKNISILTDYHANGSYKMLRNNVELLNDESYALMIRTTDLEKRNFIDGVKYIDKSAYEFLSKSKVYGGDIIINKIGSAGNVYLMPELNRKVSLGMNQFLLRTNEYIKHIYLYILFNTKRGEYMIKSKAKGAVTKTINKKSINNLQIPIPSISLQNEFAKKVQTIEEQKELMSQSLKLMEDNYNSLMQRAFKGDLF